MAGGVRASTDDLPAARARAAAQRAALAPEHRLLDARPYAVEIGERLAALRDELARELGRRAETSGR
jgi:hypothetical protein